MGKTRNKSYSDRKTRVAPAAEPEPRTPLAKELSEIRARILASAGSSLDWTGVMREVRERRGETNYAEPSQGSEDESAEAGLP